MPALETFAESPPEARGLHDSLFIAAALAWGAGLVYIEAALAHGQGLGLFTAFFGLLAATQFCWGVALYRSPSRRLLIAGVTVSVGVVALWIMSLTLSGATLANAASPGLFLCKLTASGLGLPLGHTHGTPQSVGPLDLIATGDEILLALIVILHLNPSAAGAVARGAKRLVTAAAMCLILLSSIALTLVDHAH